MKGYNVMGWRKIDKNKRYSYYDLHEIIHLISKHVKTGTTDEEIENCKDKFWKFVKKNNVTHFLHDCTNKIIPPELFNEFDYNLIDHHRVYKDDNNKIIIVSQPYLKKKHIKKLEGLDEYCKQNNIRYEVDDKGSWYYPNNCCLLKIYLD